jgi:hypothetical protein
VEELLQQEQEDVVRDEGVHRSLPWAGAAETLLPARHASVTIAGAGRIPRSGTAKTLRDD